MPVEHYVKVLYVPRALTNDGVAVHQVHSRHQDLVYAKIELSLPSRQKHPMLR